jgi:hypothetical protein
MCYVFPGVLAPPAYEGAQSRTQTTLLLRCIRLSLARASLDCGLLRRSSLIG